MNDKTLHEGILQLLPSDATADWDDVLRRGGVTVTRDDEGPVHRQRSRWGRFFASAARRPRTVIAVAAALLVIAGGGGALAYRYLGPSPGFTAGFSAFDRLPAAPVPPAMPKVGIEHMAAYLGLSVQQAESRLRLLQSGLTLGPGRTRGQGALYALVGENGTACMFLSGQGGTCLDLAHLADTDGVMAQVEPGYPGQTPAVVALVADNVRSVNLELAGKTVSVPIVNNSIYADMANVQACDSVGLAVTYDDGSTRIVTLPNPVGGVLTTAGSGAGKQAGPGCSR